MRPVLRPAGPSLVSLASELQHEGGRKGNSLETETLSFFKLEELPPDALARVMQVGPSCCPDHRRRPSLSSANCGTVLPSTCRSCPTAPIFNMSGPLLPLKARLPMSPRLAAALERARHPRGAPGLQRPEQGATGWCASKPGGMPDSLQTGQLRALVQAQGQGQRMAAVLQMRRWHARHAAASFCPRGPAERVWCDLCTACWGADTDAHRWLVPPRPPSTPGTPGRAMLPAPRTYRLAGMG